MQKLLLFLLPFHAFLSFSQEYPQDYFRSPLDIPIYLSGNFGELRSNHFHAGLDIKTEGVQGKKIYAVADGFVSRIKVSPYGYGNALYVTHPNGYTSVYGHLKKYSDRITEVVAAEQYAKESFAVQVFPPPFKLQVKKGEVIAYSGNTGGSGGPHLHFEIRETASEHPINPLFFGFDVKDHLSPDIYAIAIYPLNDTSFVNGSTNMKRFRTTGANGKYRLQSSTPIQLYGDIGFGIQTVDRMDGTGNKYGLHNLKLKHGEEVVFEQQIDEFAFHEGRYINSHIDYPTYARYRRRIQKSFVDPNNKLRIYKQLKNKGKLNLIDGKQHQITYIASDLFGNASTLEFSVNVKKFDRPKSDQLKAKVEAIFQYERAHTFTKDEIMLKIPKGVLYDDLYFQYRKEAPLANTLSPVYWLHEPYTPLHSYMTITIKGDYLTAGQRKKALIVSTTNGKSLYAEGGKWYNDFISVRSRSFGGYAIALDTTAPTIRPINIYNGANMSKKWSISLKIDDNLSGISNYRGTVDGKWVLMQYDAKNKLLSYYFDERVKAGKHHFKLVVTDDVGNQKSYEADFIR